MSDIEKAVERTMQVGERIITKLEAEIASLKSQLAEKDAEISVLRKERELIKGWAEKFIGVFQKALTEMDELADPFDAAMEAENGCA